MEGCSGLEMDSEEAGGRGPMIWCIEGVAAVLLCQDLVNPCGLGGCLLAVVWWRGECGWGGLCMAFSKTTVWTGDCGWRAGGPGTCENGRSFNMGSNGWCELGWQRKRDPPVSRCYRCGRRKNLHWSSLGWGSKGLKVTVVCLCLSCRNHRDIPEVRSHVGQPEEPLDQVFSNCAVQQNHLGRYWFKKIFLGSIPKGLTQDSSF